MPNEVIYGHCPNCGSTQPFNHRVPNHVLHAIITIFSCGLWAVVWIIASMAEKAPYCGQCGLTGDRAKEEAKRAHKADKKAAEAEHRHAWNTEGPPIGLRVRVTGGEFKGRFGTVVEKTKGAVTIEDKKGRRKTLPTRDFWI